MEQKCAARQVSESQEDPNLIFIRYYLPCMSQASYLFGDKSSGRAYVVDPRRDANQYIKDAQKHGLTLKGVLETHIHTDFVSGHLELSKSTGAPVYIGENNKVSYSHIPVQGGLSIRVSDSYCIVAMSTPGHTPGCVSYILEHKTRGPIKAFTGDILFVGAVGQPDLCGCNANGAQEMASVLFDSLWSKLLLLPPSVEVCPTHGPRSPCGRSCDANDLCSTIGKEIETNPGLQFSKKQDFIDYITKTVCDTPQYFPFAVVLNKIGAECVQQYVESIPALSAEDFFGFYNICDSGVLILDSREAVDFASGHIPRSLNFPLGDSSGELLRREDGTFAIWVGTILAANKPLLVISPPGKEDETALRIARIGYSNVLGVLKGGISAWKAAEYPIEENPLIMSFDSAKLLGDPDIERKFLDVRTDIEFTGCDGHVKNAIHIPMTQLHRRFGELSKKPEYIVYCSAGYRSVIASSLLKSAGFKARSIFGGYELNLLPNHPELIFYEESNDFAV
uniref:Beta-lactamase domain-containing protein n=1 Tax=Hirondellea gigas TaxID=1518452 RepID=A0A6A7FUH6_9CRUS